MDDQIDGKQGIDEFLDAYTQWLRSFNQAITTWVTRAPQKITCFECQQAEPGCCYQKTMISFAEALVIAVYLKRHALDTPELRNRLQDHGEAMEGASRAAWFHESHPCVFLKDGRCQIYSVRPTICSSYYVISPAEQCQTSAYNEILHIDNTEALAVGIRNSLQVHRAIGLKENQMRMHTGAMPRLVQLALEAWDVDNFHSFMRSQSWPTRENLDDWTDGKNPFSERLYQIRKKDAG